MKLRNKNKWMTWLLAMMMIVAFAFTAVGCNTKESIGTQETEIVETAAEETVEAVQGEVTVLGEGTRVFLFTVTDGEGTETAFEIHTEKEKVGDALLDLGLIAGDEGEFGLYVKEVNGITADYDIDQTYWAFYVNGEYAVQGVDATAIEEGVSYSFKVEK